MASLTAGLALLERLKQQYGVCESIPPFGSAVIVPNSDYRPKWTSILAEAEFKVFSGTHEGRVAWIIPLNPRRNNPGSNPGRGCITGRSWTREEDVQLLEAWNKGMTVQGIAETYAERLKRTERAVRDRLRKLRRHRISEKPRQPRRAHAAIIKPQSQPQTEKVEVKGPATPGSKQPPSKETPGQTQPSTTLKNLLSACLILAEDPRHNEAIRVLHVKAGQLL